MMSKKVILTIALIACVVVAIVGGTFFVSEMNKGASKPVTQCKLLDGCQTGFWGDNVVVPKETSMTVFSNNPIAVLAAITTLVGAIGTVYCGARLAPPKTTPT